MQNRELWLARTMAELADTEDDDADEADYPRLLVERLGESLGTAEVAWLASQEAGGVGAVTASTQRARNLTCWEQAHGEGPTIECCRTGQAALNRSVAAISISWPAFAAAANADGFTTVSSLPVAGRSLKFGAISVLGAADYRLAPAQACLAQELAQFAVTASIRRREFRQSAQAARQLQEALDSRVLIEQAKGAVAARLGLTPDQAFEVLRGYARRHRRKLRDVARAVIGGALSAHVLRRAPARGAAGAPRRPADSAGLTTAARAG